MASPVERLFLVVIYTGGGENPFQDARRVLAMLLTMQIFLHLKFLSQDKSIIIPVMGITSFKLCNGFGPM